MPQAAICAKRADVFCKRQSSAFIWSINNQEPHLTARKNSDIITVSYISQVGGGFGITSQSAPARRRLFYGGMVRGKNIQRK